MKDWKRLVFVDNEIAYRDSVRTGLFVIAAEWNVRQISSVLRKFQVYCVNRASENERIRNAGFWCFVEAHSMR